MRDLDVLREQDGIYLPRLLLFGCLKPRLDALVLLIKVVHVWYQILYHVPVTLVMSCKISKEIKLEYLNVIYRL